MIEERFSFRNHSDEYDIHGLLWLPEGPPRGLVQIVHGINDYGGRFSALAEYLNTQGIAVAAHDQLGHGLTAAANGRLGFFTATNGWENAVADAAACSALLAARFPGLPLVIYGHSMGSFVIRCLLADYPNLYAAAIFSGTASHGQLLYALGKLICRVEQLIRGKQGFSELVRAISIGSCSRAFRQEGHPAAWLTRDADIYRAYGHDPSCRFLPSIEMYYQMFRGMSYMDKPSTYRRMPAELPMLLLSGKDDPAGDMGRAPRKLHRNWQACGFKVDLLLYPKARHELHSELNRQQVFADVLAWMEPFISSLQQSGNPQKSLFIER